MPVKLARLALGHPSCENPSRNAPEANLPGRAVSCQSSIPAVSDLVRRRLGDRLVDAVRREKVGLQRILSVWP